MLRQFAQKVEDLRRLIENQRSASVSVGGVGSHGGRKNPSHFVGPSPCGQGGSTLSATVASHSASDYLLAVSGGMDSMCLLDLFSKVLPVSDFAVAHCNFSLRGEESDGDQALVEEYCAALGVRVFVKRFDTVGYAREKGISIEMAARELRYDWFGQLCREYGFDVLAVAHNANDNAETLMLNLLRGTGLAGLHGMAEISWMCASCNVPEISEPPVFATLEYPASSICHPDPSLCHPERSEGSVLIFRPLLAFTRKQIEGYVLAHRVPYRHDSSNFTSDYKRNRIRNEVFPVFEKINPSFIRTLNREIGYFSEAGSIVEDWCRSQLPNVLLNHPERSEGSVTISTAALLSTPHWRYLLYYILSPYGFNAQTLASIESLLTSERTVPGKRFDSPTHTLLTGRGVLTLVPQNAITSDPINEARRTLTQSDDMIVVRGEGTYNFNGVRFSVETLEYTSQMPLKQPAGTLIFDAAALRFPFVARRWRQGDWLIPFGMRGRKKVSDLFADLKYDTLAKESAIILVDTRTPGLAEQQHIAALLGHRIDDRYKATSSTARLLRITILQ